VLNEPSTLFLSRRIVARTTNTCKARTLDLVFLFFAHSSQSIRTHHTQIHVSYSSIPRLFVSTAPVFVSKRRVCLRASKEAREGHLFKGDGTHGRLLTVLFPRRPPESISLILYSLDQFFKALGVIPYAEFLVLRKPVPRFVLFVSCE